MEKYNTRVREVISEEYVKSSKRIAQIQRKREDVLVKLENNKDILSYNEYTLLKKNSEGLQRQYEYEKVRLDIWDKAREICLNIADEIL